MLFPLLALEEMDIEEEEEEVLLVVACVLGGIAEVQQRRSAVRHRLYLRRAELMPNPNDESPWQRLRASQNDRAFITTMGIDVPTFDTILARGFAFAWSTRTHHSSRRRPDTWKSSSWSTLP